MTLGYPRSDMVSGLKGQRSKVKVRVTCVYCICILYVLLRML